MNETRVNLKHLLEDIRDSYSHPVEEVILSELIANALDSGASLIQMLADSDRGTLTVLDNGCGMRRPVMREYHNIAATIKERVKESVLSNKITLLDKLEARHRRNLSTASSQSGVKKKCPIPAHFSNRFCVNDANTTFAMIQKEALEILKLGRNVYV